jgi:hypothetical protein
MLGSRCAYLSLALMKRRSIKKAPTDFFPIRERLRRWPHEKLTRKLA